MNASPTALSENKYRPSQREIWQGRHNGFGPERLHEVIQMIDLREGIPFPETATAWGVIGFACDEGVRRNQGRCGAAQGPEAIRKALANLPIKRIHEQTFYDFGDIMCPDGNLEEAQSTLGEINAQLLKNQIRPLVIGGGHEVAWGNYQGVVSAYPSKECMIINMDAHFDLRPLVHRYQGTSGTAFQQIAAIRQEQQLPFNCYYLGIQPTGNTQTFFDKAEALGAKVMLADEFHEGGFEACLGLIDETTSQTDLIYLSICLDVFAAAFAPGVSSPQPLGLYPWHLIPVLKRLAASGKVMSLDIAEMCPPYDIDGMTAKLAAALIGQFIASTPLTRSE
jgi:formiminoglutamase